jgi:hypothetical protein
VTELEIVGVKSTRPYFQNKAPQFLQHLQKATGKGMTTTTFFKAFIFTEKVFFVRQKLQNRADHSFSKKFDLLTL